MTDKYCVYARPPGFWNWVTMGWSLVGISEENKLGGYGPDAERDGWLIMRVVMRPPLPFRFWFKPRKATVVE